MSYSKKSVTWFGALAAGLFALSGCAVDTSETGEDVASDQEALNQVFWALGLGTGYLRHFGGPAACEVVDPLFTGWHVGWLSGTGHCKYTVAGIARSSTVSMKTLRIDGGNAVWTPAAHYTPIPPGAIRSDSGKHVCFVNGGLNQPGERDGSDGKCHYVGNDGMHHIIDSYFFVASGPIIIPPP